MKYDIAVIRGGPGGYIAAIYAAKHKAKVVLIEKDKLGGTCLNYGCIPTKALIHSAQVYRESIEASRFGVIHKEVRVNWARAQEHRRSIVSKLNRGVKTLLRKNNVTVTKGTAKLADENTVKVIRKEKKKSFGQSTLLLHRVLLLPYCPLREKT